MKKINSLKIFLSIFTITILLFPIKAFAKQDVVIQIDGKTYNINNYLDNKTNRTYVSIGDFCAKTSLCEYKGNTIEKKIYSDFNDVGKVNNVYYVVEFSKTDNTIKNNVVFDNWGSHTGLGISRTPKSDTKAFSQVLEKVNGAATTVTYVPLRFFADSMWYNVGWNGNSKTVSITTYNPVVKYNHMQGQQVISTNGCPAPKKYVREGSTIKDNTWDNLKSEKMVISTKVVAFQICNTNSGEKFYIGEAYIKQ